MSADDERTEACPSEEELAHFAEAPWPGSPILAHLDHCEDCRFLSGQVAGAGPAPQPPVSGDEIRGREAAAHYLLAGVAGRGGMGTVYEALDVRVGRAVALKVLHEDDPARLRRFLREARITASLDHPSIVSVFEIGELDDGAAYYTQRLVRGRTLAEAIAAGERLALLPHFLDVCQAIAYAHQLRIIHRDIKPGNVLIGSFGETTVVDWGLARSLDLDEEETSGEHAGDTPVDRTLAGKALGTPAYMSPEQARGAHAEVNERSDVWSLGAVLYELVAGAPPFRGNTLAEICAQVLTSAPPPLPAGAPRELAAIVSKALSQRPSDRYPSAVELAADVAAYLRGGRVGTYQYSLLELLRRVVAQHRASAAALAAGLLLGALWAGQSWRQNLKLRHEYAQEMISQALRYGRIDQWDRTAVYFAAARVAEERPDARLGQVAFQDFGLRPIWRSMRHDASVLAAAFSLDGALLATGDARGVLIVSGVESAEAVHKLVLREPVRALAFGLRGVLAASAGARVRLFEAKGGVELPSLEAPGEVLSLAADESGRYLAAGTSAGLRLWDLETRAALPLPATDEAAPSVAWAEGTLLWAAGRRGVARLAHAATRPEALEPLTWPGLDAVAVSVGGAVTLAQSRRGDLVLFDPARDPEPFHLRAIMDRAFVRGSLSRDGEIVATVDAAGFPQLVSTGTRTVFAAVGGTMSSVNSLTWAPGSARVAVTRADGLIAIWDASGSLRALGARAFPVSRPTGLAFSPDGKRLASSDDEGRIRLWSAEKGGAVPLALLGSHRGRASQVAFSPGGQLASAGPDGVRLWDAGARSSLGTLSGEAANALAWDPRGRYLVAAAPSGLVKFFTPSGAAAREPLQHEGEVFALAISTDGAWLAAGGADRVVRVWSLDHPGPPRLFKGHSDRITSLAFLSDGRLGSGSPDRTLRIWDPKTGVSQTLSGQFEGAVLSIAASTGRGAPYRDAILSGTDHGLVELWDPGHGQRLLEMPRAAITAGEAVAFSPDGAVAAWMLSDGGLHLLALRDEEKLGSPDAELERLLRLYQFQWENAEMTRDDKLLR